MSHLNTLRKVPMFYADKNDLSVGTILDFVFKHKTYVQRYNTLNDYYIGKHSILNRTMEGNKPNNKPITNFAEYITTVKNGYFLGEPVTYTSDKSSLKVELDILFDNNDETDVNAELSKLTSINGHAFEILYIDGNAEIKFKEMSPVNMFAIYDTSIEANLICAIRYYEAGTSNDATADDVNYNMEVYYDDRIEYYTFKGTKERNESALTDTKTHPFGTVPVIEYINNEERLGDFENIINLIDNYEVVLADSVNEVQYFNDAYLILKGLLATEDSDIADMKNNRVIETDAEGSVEWLVKNVNNKHIEELLERIKNDIHKFSKTPDLNSEEFASNLSGVAIAYKLWTLEQDISNKERKFKRALRKRLKLITNVLNRLYNVEGTFRDVRIKFSRNVPQNEFEVTQMVQLLQGLISDKTRRELLPYIDNPQAEEDLLDTEFEKNKEKQESFDFDLTDGNQDLNPNQKTNGDNGAE